MIPLIFKKGLFFWNYTSGNGISSNLYNNHTIIRLSPVQKSWFCPSLLPEKFYLKCILQNYFDQTIRQFFFFLFEFLIDTIQINNYNYNYNFLLIVWNVKLNTKEDQIDIEVIEELPIKCNRTVKCMSGKFVRD